MLDQRSAAAELRLRRLAVDLKKAYSRVARHVADTLAPFEVVIADIGEPWRPDHYPESFQKRGPDAAVHPPSCFAVESFVNGDEAEYALCVGRGPDMKCGLYVSACRYQIRPGRSGGNGDGDKQTEVAIKNILLVPPASLPVPLRMKMLDVLDEFAAAYDLHVREARKAILHDDGGEESPAAPARAMEILAEVPASDPVGAPVDRSADPPRPEPPAEKTPRGRARLVNPDGTPFGAEPVGARR